MKLRPRLAVMLGGVVAAVMILVLATSFLFSQSTIRESVDNRLREDARTLLRAPPGFDFRPESLAAAVAAGRDGDGRGRGRQSEADRFRNRPGLSQLIYTDGSTFGTSLQVDDQIVQSVRTTGQPVFSNQMDEDGTAIRVYTVALSDSVIAQLAADTTPLSTGFSTIRQGLLYSGLFGIAAAALLGWLVAGRFTKPIAEVTAAAHGLARNQDLPTRIEVNRSDEVGDLATSFNQMMTDLHVSRQQQQRLVADASHELRTPLTSLRMKVDFLKQEPDLPAEKRQDIVRGAAVELESLSELVTELVQLASNNARDDKPENINVGSLVEDVAHRAQLSTGRLIDVSVSDSAMTVHPKMVRRAVSNLIDNAHKYSPTDRSIEVSEQHGRIEVRDHGPGIAAADQPRAFDRFFRADDARKRPGSGIGLALVKQAADRHGGTTWVSDAEGGGAVVGFSVRSVSRG